MRILLISKTYPAGSECGGTGTMAKVIAEGLVARGHEVTVLASAGVVSAVDNQVRILGRLILDQPRPDKPATAWTVWDQALWIRKARHNHATVAGQIRAGGPDLVYFNDIERLTGAVFAAAVEADVRCIWHAHDRVLRDMLSHSQDVQTATARRRFAQRLIRAVEASHYFATPLIAVSHSVAADYRQLGWPAELISVVANGLPEYFFTGPSRHAPDRRHWPLLFVGRCVEDKGLPVLLPLLTELRRRALPVRLVMVGSFRDEAVRSAFAAAAARRGLADHVELRAPVARQELSALYATAGCLLVPSLIPEGLPLVSLEAQACGLPVVASRVGGLPETLVEGRTGFVCEPGDAETMAARVEQLYSDSSLWQAMSDAAREFAAASFNLKDKLDQIEQLIQPTASRPPR